MKAGNFNFPVVGFLGKQGAGKSEAAKILETYGYRRRSFASPLKEMCRAIGIPEKNLTGTTEEKIAEIDILQRRNPIILGKIMLNSIGIKTFDMLKGVPELDDYSPEHAIQLMLDIRLFHSPSARVFQQLLGTEWGRKISDNLWVNIWNSYYEKNKRSNFVVDDVRFQNEIDAVKAKKGILIKLLCEDVLENQGVANHASENDSLKADIELFNRKENVADYENSLIQLLEYMN